MKYRTVDDSLGVAEVQAIVKSFASRQNPATTPLIP